MIEYSTGRSYETYPPGDFVAEQIAALDQNISRMEGIESRLLWELSEIQSSMKAIRNQRANMKSRIAVVWSLPNEILAYIFELGVRNEEGRMYTEKDDDDDDDDGHEDEPAFNILVSHVCRRFREIAIHTPTLWTQIHILDLETPRLDFVRACVKRSGSSGLDIFIDCNGGRFEVDFAPVPSLMDILDPHISRFRRFTVRISGFQPLYQIMVRLNKPAPQLESLELYNIDTETDFDEEDPFHPALLREPLTLFDGIMPKLECVSLDGAHAAWTKCNFTGLKSLHLGYHTRDVRPTYDEFKAIIDASPTLHTLDLRGSAPLISTPSVYPPLQMERLEVLHISEMTCDIATALMSLFNTPNLLSLSLMDLTTNGDSSFFHRIIGPPALFPALTKLKLGSVAMNEDTFEGLLRASSKLTHLSLYLSSRIPTSWLVYLEPKSPENEVVCPKLECLRCVNASPWGLNTLLERRRDAGFPIATLQLDKKTPDYWQDWECLKEYATVELIDPSDPGTDYGMDGSGSDWATEDDDIGGFPITMGGFSDDDDEEEYEDTSEMEVDQTDDSENEGEEEEEEEEEAGGIIF